MTAERFDLDTLSRDAKPALAAQPPKAPRRAGAVEMPILLAITITSLAYGWIHRNDGEITAETGVGYYLGIIGGIMMLVLLAYPLRKRLRAFRFLGTITGWFRIHMILGMFGPTLVILHSNFSMGSLNSSVAMWSMLIVAGSGFMGRFLYSHVHRGLYGHRQTARTHIEEAYPIKAKLRSLAGKESDAFEMLAQYEAQRTGNLTGFWRSLLNTMNGPMSRSQLRRRVLIDIRQTLNLGGFSRKEAREELDNFDAALRKYLRSLARAEAFTLYERLFAGWHLLHLPLFVILVLASVAHVIAVHLY